VPVGFSAASVGRLGLRRYYWHSVAPTPLAALSLPVVGRRRHAEYRRHDRTGSVGLLLAGIGHRPTCRSSLPSKCFRLIKIRFPTPREKFVETAVNGAICESGRESNFRCEIH